MSKPPADPGGIRGTHGWAEARNFSPDDQLLRLHGFTILSRHKNQEPVWQRDGRPYLQRQALALARGEQMEATS